MMDMGIPNDKAELALSETGNVGVEVATEWLFSVPDHVLEKHLASEPNTPVEAAAQNPEDHRVMLPRRVPLQVCKHSPFAGTYMHSASKLSVLWIKHVKCLQKCFSGSSIEPDMPLCHLSCISLACACCNVCFCTKKLHASGIHELVHRC